MSAATSNVTPRGSGTPTTASMEGPSQQIREILDRAESGEDISVAEGTRLFEATGTDFQAVVECADRLRQAACGDRATFVITRNINFTNVCYMGCKFCNFAKRRQAPDAELFSLQEVVVRAEEAWRRGASEVCIQGGLHPELPGHHYRDIVAAIKERLPDLHIHAFSPFEIWYGARKSRMGYRAFIEDLQRAGLGSMPGTAAEILDTEVRRQLTQDKLSTSEWVEIISTAHELGLPTTSTIMYGHIDGPCHWAEHLALLRSIQQRTGGFTEFVPLGFIHHKTRLFHEVPGVRPGPTRREHVLMHAVGRIMLNGWIDNIQASWVKLGPELARDMLKMGANDLGGTLMNESISRAAGGEHGQEMLPQDMVRAARSAGRVPVRRSTLYQPLEEFDDSLICRLQVQA